MKTEKIKRYRMPVSRTFPKSHPRAGEETNFVYKICSALGSYGDQLGQETYANNIMPKYHTIRSNYDLWINRMAKVHAGLAVIELFYWDGRPYHSKQIVFATLDMYSRCGVQIVKFKDDMFCAELNTYSFDRHIVGIEVIAPNDGLSVEDFKAWFKGYDLSELMAIIHFTKFRY